MCGGFLYFIIKIGGVEYEHDNCRTRKNGDEISLL